MHVGDSIFLDDTGRWSFAGTVADTFDAHVSKSVPLYNEGHDLICFMSDFFVGDGGVCYDLGASTGTLLRKLAHRHRDVADLRFIGVDPIAEMIVKAAAASTDPRLTYVCGALPDIDLDKADMIISYYCLQFLRPEHREAAQIRIYDALRPGGAYFWFEKEVCDDPVVGEMIDSCYYKYKADNGFGSSEILKKKFSLEGVLVPEPEARNRAALRRVGYRHISSILRYGRFQGYVAIK